MDFNKDEIKNEDKDKFETRRDVESKELFDQIPDDVLSEFSEELTEPTMGLFSRIINVFTSPKEVMQDVKIKSSTAILLLIFATVGLITTLPTISIIKDGLLDAMLAQGADANIDSAMLDSILNYTLIVTVVATIIGSVLAPLISGLASHVIAILMGGEGKFKQTIAVNTMAYTVVVAGSILRVALVLITKNMYASFSPAMFLGANPTTNPLYSFVSVIEIFNLIYLYFVYIGIKVVHNVSNIKAWMITLLPTVIILLISAIPLLLV